MADQTVRSQKGRQAEDSSRIAAERHSQRLVTAFIAIGMLFMLLPGTFLGVWNLIGISQQHSLDNLSPAWLQAHGHAQMFGWIGSFILGIGFYSLTKMQSRLAFPVRSAWTSLVVWTLGITLRWTSAVTGFYWRVLLPLSGFLELVAFFIFYSSVRAHRPASDDRPRETWMLLVSAGTAAFLSALLVNFVAMANLAAVGNTPALPHVLDQQLITLGVWGVLVPTIWGFNARWLPIFAGLRKPNGGRLLVAYGCSVAGVVAALMQRWTFSAGLLLIAALLAIDALNVWEPAVRPAKVQDVHHTFPLFLRVPYVWLGVSCILNALAVPFDHAGGIWGASRHAITVGFIAGMVFVIGQRILPPFCGMRILWSPRLMLWSLLLLHVGCALRVLSEPLAYEGYWWFAWKLLPCSAVVELSAVTLFAWNIFATLLQPPAHLRLVSIQTVRGAAQ